MIRYLRPLAAAVLFATPLLGQQTPSTPTTGAPQATADVVVSATKVDEDPEQIPNAVSVVSGEQLRKRGARTVAEAIQDVVGVDTGNGSDNGPRLANVGMWGLKEFDALLITVDGVPAGGPFNPSLSQIPVDDIDRIEVVKGPQGTLYGVSAFAGMIQVFTRRPSQAGGGSVTLGGGSFGEKRLAANYSAELPGDVTVRAYGSMLRGNGWQDRTDASSDRLTLVGEKRWGETRLGVTLLAYRDTNDFGSPLPVDAGQPIPGFVPERNYAIQGARLDHRVYALRSSFSTPLGQGLRLENTLGLDRDEQNSVRSFIGTVEGTQATASGVSLRPVDSTFYDDLRLVAEFQAAGSHRLVGGAALTWGRTTAAGHGFDFDLTVTPLVVPAIDSIPWGDNRSYEDRRTFLGFYVNDEWTPTPRLTLTAGARLDETSESLSISMQEIGTPGPDTAAENRSDGQFSGGVSALFRILTRAAGPLDSANLYVSARSAFKPAAPNLSEAESARILQPERTRSGEVGLKTRWMDKSLGFDVSLFHMNFENMVVSTLGQDGQPLLANAGEQRFQGAELDLSYRPPALQGVELAAGYAHHDATFVHFSFLTPDGSLRVVDGKRLELVPRDLWNVSLSYAAQLGPGAFVAVRHQNTRPLTRRNTFYTDGFFETDAGVSWSFPWARFSVVGRNLGDDRHYVSDSEIGDSQFYVATPRRFSAEVSFRF